MNIRIPQPTQAARLLKQYFAQQGIEIRHTQALEAIARLHGYLDWHALQADTRFQEAPALKPVSDNEYVLRDGSPAAWIQVESISVSVTRTDEGVCVDLYAKGHEDDSLAGTCLHFSEVEPDDEPAAAPFVPTPVDWSRVSEMEDISHLRINRGRSRELITFDRFALRKLSDFGDLSANPRLAQTPAFSYTVAEGHGVQNDVPLGLLQRAVERQPGVIGLEDGRQLELLVDTEDGLRLYSPAQDNFVA